MEIKVKIWPQFCFFDRVFPIRDSLKNYISTRYPDADVDISIEKNVSTAGLDGCQYWASIDGCPDKGEDMINEWTESPTADKARFG